MTSTKQTVLIVGATGAQGAAIVKSLSETGKYQLLALTRKVESQRAQELAALPNVELVASASDHGYDLAAFSKAAERSDAVFINTDGFAVGEIAETYWGIRLFQLSIRAGVKHVVYSGLDNIGKATNYADEFYVGHYEGKARVQEWIHGQDPKSATGWTILRSGPYINMLSEALLPQTGPDGTKIFAFPLGEEGQMPFVPLEDFGPYVDWILSHPDESKGLDFGIAIEHAGLKEVAAAYTAATGQPATYYAIDNDSWQDAAWGKLPKGKDTKIGYLSVKDDNALTLTHGENFTNWYNLYKASAGNKGLITRDYAFLDKILPTRYKSVEEWMRKTGYTGEPKKVLNRNLTN
ncbi:hypothetical protein BX600DRAFT_494070 [Xylariales sp. PMI_506]|nr:hypothetical protein BX600DRAFT_494070 [Xylariales sp. PMI_506]